VLREAAQVEKVKETDYSHSNSDNWVHALIMQGLNAGGRMPISYHSDVKRERQAYALAVDSGWKIVGLLLVEEALHQQGLWRIRLQDRTF